jgi:hypothetical protein
MMIVNALVISCALSGMAQKLFPGAMALDLVLPTTAFDITPDMVLLTSWETTEAHHQHFPSKFVKAIVIVTPNVRPAWSAGNAAPATRLCLDALGRQKPPKTTASTPSSQLAPLRLPPHLHPWTLLPHHQVQPIDLEKRQY